MDGTPQEPAPIAPAFTPLSGMKVAADGSVSYDFEGHVSADGVDLQASNTEAVPADRKVRWLRESDGAQVAAVEGYRSEGFTAGGFTFPASSSLTARVAPINAPGDTGTNLRLYRNDNGQGGIQFGVAGAPVFAGSNLMDHEGRSSFMRTVRGASGTVGGIPNQVPTINPWGGGVGTSFTLNHPATCLVGMNVSGYAPGAGQVWWALHVNGIAVATSGFYFNQGGVHHSLGWCIAVVSLPTGTHTLTTTNPATALTVDFNDTCSWFVIG